ncbi:MAG: hypothetical protein HQK96_11600 [Nitrospirae bacterium]|nr:hypothetical protein [Nitrospirota bacterium]
MSKHKMPTIESLDYILNQGKGWPTEKELENDWVYQNNEYIEKIEDLLRENKICLIMGAEGRGKTVLARLVGYRIMKYKLFRNGFIKAKWDIFVIDMSEINDIEEICGYINSTEGTNLLYIIENAHIDDKMSLKLVDAAEAASTNKGASFIFTARKIYTDDGNNDDNDDEDENNGTNNPFNGWMKMNWHVDIDSDINTVKGIITKFIKEKNISFETDEDITWIRANFNNGNISNLRRLRFYLRAWYNKKKDSEEDPLLSDMKENDVLKYVYNFYFVEQIPSDLHEMLIQVASVFQYDVTFYGEHFNHSDLERLCNEKIITRVQDDYYKLEHSTDAAYIVKAKSHHDKKNLNDVIIGYLTKYLQTEPDNYSELLQAITKNDKTNINILFGLFNVDTIYNIILNKTQKDSIKTLSLVICCLTWACGYKGTQDFWKDYINLYNGFNEVQKTKVNNNINNATLSELTYILSLLKSAAATDRGWLVKQISNFETLGMRSKEDNLPTVGNFLIEIKQAGVKTVHIYNFCKGLDFFEFGVHSKGAGLQAGGNFLKRAQQAGVDTAHINNFCKGLGFEALGQQSTNGGLATIMQFLCKVRQVGVNTYNRNNFCKGLDFTVLGQNSKEGSLATIVYFLKEAVLAMTDNKRLKKFCEQLEWKLLGDTISKKINESGSLLFLFHSFFTYSFISTEMIMSFIEGFSCSTFNYAIHNYFSPDVVASLVKILTIKCNLNPIVLQSIQLDLDPKIIWFKAFTNTPFTPLKRGQEDIKKAYFPYTGKIYYKHAEKEFIKNVDSLSLKQWNILIHNISVICKPDYIKDKIAPILQSFTKQQYEDLFSNSDLNNISRFLKLYSSEDKSLNWQIPDTIDFTRIDFLAKIPDDTLEAISHFLFTFYVIKKGDCSHFFAKQLNDKHLVIFPKIEQATIKELDFFFWNFWMAMPTGQSPNIFRDASIIQIINDKLADNDKESILGLFGTLKLAMPTNVTTLSNLIPPGKANAICSKAVKENLAQSIRLLGGCISLSMEKETLRELHNKFEEKFETPYDIPNQKKALDFIKEFLNN